MKKITAAQLRRLGACKEQLARFEALFPKGVVPTRALCLAHARDFSWEWAAARLLPTSALVAYNAARASAWTTCEAARAPAQAAYNAACASAWTTYEAAGVSAQAAYNAARAPAWADAAGLK